MPRSSRKKKNRKKKAKRRRETRDQAQKFPAWKNEKPLLQRSGKTTEIMVERERTKPTPRRCLSGGVLVSQKTELSQNCHLPQRNMRDNGGLCRQLYNVLLFIPVVGLTGKTHIFRNSRGNTTDLNFRNTSGLLHSAWTTHKNQISNQAYFFCGEYSCIAFIIAERSKKAPGVTL